MPLGYNGQVYVMDLLMVNDLPFPVLLGHDAPDFDVLLCVTSLHASVALSNDEKVGFSGLGTDNARPHD